MPNNCQNLLIISGPITDLKKFEEKSADRKFQLQNYWPMPEDPENHIDEPHWSDALSSLPDWYKWRLMNWGTKWDLYEERGMWITYDESTGVGDLTMSAGEEIRISFLSAWSPPDKGIENICTLWPNLKFTLIYVEVGNDFAGTNVYDNGQKISEISGDVEEYLSRYDFSLAY